MAAENLDDKRALEDVFNRHEATNNADLIRLQDAAYDLGVARGKKLAGDAIAKHLSDVAEGKREDAPATITVERDYRPPEKVEPEDDIQF